MVWVLMVMIICFYREMDNSVFLKKLMCSNFKNKLHMDKNSHVAFVAIEDSGQGDPTLMP